jgi:CubicO group peptidase (beta-lactamase class C family)
MAILTAAWATQPSVVRAQSASAPPADRHKQVDAIFAPWNGTTTPGCAVGISRDGVLDYTRGYGMSNLEYDIAITPESIFLVGSISKQFTAFSIALLAQDGKLSLDDDIRKYLPEMPDFGKTITIAHLIHHRSGLREQGQLLYLAGWRGDDMMTEADMLAIAAKQRGLNFAPGTETLYNNLGYTLLAVIVKRVSGKPLWAFADERIFQPLGMTDTHFQDDHTEIVRRRAAGYQSHKDGGWRISIPASDYYGPTGLFTTVGDLLKWQENFVHARVGGKALLASMQTSATSDDGAASGYGGGVFVRSYRGLRTIGHDGVHAGYRADAIAFPDQRLAIVTLCNGATISPPELAQKVAAVYLGDRMTPMAPSVKVPEAELSTLTGVYWSSLTDEVVRVEVKDGALRPAGASSPLESLGRGLFRLGETGRWRFDTSGDEVPGARELQIWDAWPTPRIFTRVNEPMPSAATLASFAGQYRIDEVDMTYAVLMTDGKLTLRWPRQTDLVLEAVGGDRFVSGAWTVTFTRSASGAVDGLTMTARRLRRMRAERLTTVQTSVIRAGKSA